MDTATCERFRALWTGSPTTAENTIRHAVHLHKYVHGETIHSGEPLRQPVPQPSPPSPVELSEWYSRCDLAKWPQRDAGHWWRAWIVLASYTGLRAGDLERLEWSQVSPGEVSIRAGKTGTLHRIPLLPHVWRHLDQLPRRAVRVFAVNGKTRKQFYREWATISGGRDQKTLRQFAVTRWTLANATAGRLIHGSGLLEGILRHYVDGYALLSDAMHNLEVPEAFCTEDERDANRKEEQELLERFKRAPSTTRRLMVELSRKLA